MMLIHQTDKLKRKKQITFKDKEKAYDKLVTTIPGQCVQLTRMKTLQDTNHQELATSPAPEHPGPDKDLHPHHCSETAY